MVAKKACMICGKEKNGTEVKEDFMIKAMRWFKENVTRNAKGYRIVVCSECMPQYRKIRGKFTRRKLIYVALGIIFTITIVAFSGGRYPSAIAYGLGITVFLYLLSLISYVPELVEKPAKASAGRR
jgi:hypothetical protein